MTAVLFVVNNVSVAYVGCVCIVMFQCRRYVLEVSSFSFPYLIFGINSGSWFRCLPIRIYH